MWKGPVTLVVICGAAVAVVPALAAQAPTITASDFAFTPSRVTITAGGTVAFANAQGFHNVEFADGPAYPAMPAADDDPAWDGLSRTFAQPGRYDFVCGAHPSMVGTVEVKAPTPAPAPNPTPTPAPPPQSSTPAPLEIRTLELAARRFCTKRGPRCRRPGVRVRIDLSQPATVTGALRRRGRSYGRVRFGTVAADARTLAFRRNAAGRRLKRGRYTLRLQVAGDPQPALRFRIR